MESCAGLSSRLLNRYKTPTKRVDNPLQDTILPHSYPANTLIAATARSMSSREL